MKASTKAVFLSALVYPGSGQFALGAVYSGAFFAIITTGGLLVFLFRLTKRIYLAVDQILPELANYRLNLTEFIDIISHSGYDSWHIDGISLVIILCCWVGSAVHAFWLGRGVDRRREHNPSESE
ncbi:MAG: hypothetical protein JSW26_26145 [Desulfobacterales bacterium]|nr:MAG: hypothetical protein JSW26_26145 [Desulfobacterales bacterium]